MYRAYAVKKLANTDLLVGLVQAHAMPMLKRSPQIVLKTGAAANPTGVIKANGVTLRLLLHTLPQFLHLLLLLGLQMLLHQREARSLLAAMAMATMTAGDLAMAAIRLSSSA
jgi:hypothetical protein